MLRSDDPPKPPPVRHAIGWEHFTEYVGPFGVAPEALMDTWTFAHVVRAHREAFEADPALQRSAVVFLGNAFIARHPDCAWRHTANGLLIESQDRPVATLGHAHIGVEGTVQAILDADEARFREFARVVDAWGPGSEGRPRRPRRRLDSRDYSPDGGL